MPKKEVKKDTKKAKKETQKVKKDTQKEKKETQKRKKDTKGKQGKGSQKKKTGKRKKRSSEIKVEIPDKLKPTKGVKMTAVTRSLNFLTSVISAYYVEHFYKEGDYAFAKLIIFKEPQNEIRGYIEFMISGIVALDRVDLTGTDSITRIYVEPEDRILFKVDTDQDSMDLTYVDFQSKYQREAKRKNPKKQIEIVSDYHIEEIQKIFDWLRQKRSADDLKSILEKVEITKGIKLKEKEKFK